VARRLEREDDECARWERGAERWEERRERWDERR
jgi:hypothetical protein